MKQLFSILCFSLIVNLSFGQDWEKAQAEVDSIRQFGIEELKEYIINRAKCHNKQLYSSEIIFKPCIDNVYFNDKPVQIDYFDTNSIEKFAETLNSLKIKELVWTKSFLNDSLGWTSKIQIKYIENEIALIERVKFEKFSIEASTVGHKIEKRKKNGQLVEKYEDKFISHYVSNIIYQFEESEMKSDEMIVWTSYSWKTMIVGFHLK